MVQAPESQVPPDLSIIITTRNDDHGENPLGRLQAMLDNLAWHAQKFSARWEFIIVEWNPPVDRPFLREVLRFPDKTNPLRIRIIQVPNTLHRRLNNWDRLPLFQMIAKNVGGRRAKGQYLLFTNMDILFSEDLAKWLVPGNDQIKKNKSRPGVTNESPGHEPQKKIVYRIDRSDCDRGIPPDLSPVQVIEWVSRNQIRINGLVGTYPVHPEGDRDEPGIIHCSGAKLGKGWTVLHDRPNLEILASPVACLKAEGKALVKGISLCLAPGPGREYRPFSLEVTVLHPRKGQVFSATAGIGLGKHLLKIRCGDEKGNYEIRLATKGKATPPKLNESLPWRLFSVEALKDDEIDPPSILVESKPWNEPNDINDILDGELVSLLGDWHPLENNSTGINTRWGGKSPILELPFPKGCRGGWLTLNLHPGPGVGAKPFWLKALDENDKILGIWGVVGWRLIHIPVKTRGRDWARIRLEATPCGFRTGQEKSDPRILNFAVSRISWQPASTAPGWFSFRGGFKEIQARAKTIVAWFLGKFRAIRQIQNPHEILPMAHMNNCGDFTLVDRDSFLASGGHSEEPVFSLNLDTLFLYRLLAMGLKEEILKKPLEIFHIEHGKGTGATPEGMGDLMGRLRENGIPVLELEEVFDRARGFFLNPGLIHPSPEDWGFAREILPEESFCGAQPS